MKYLIILTDGASDLPIPELDGLTPLEAADTPTFDRLARRGVLGLVQTVPPGMKPGSDTANMAVMGYNPRLGYSGRSPLEALSLGIDLGPLDLACRVNLVSLNGLGAGMPTEEDYDRLVLADYSAGEIATDEAARLIALLNRELADWLAAHRLELYPGVSYRHCLVWRDGLARVAEALELPLDRLPATAPERVALVEQVVHLTPAHDLTGRQVTGHLPAGPAAGLLLELQRRSAAILGPEASKADGLWAWGIGTRPALAPLAERYGLRGSAISAVDLVRGLGVAIGMAAPAVPGATGTWETDYEAKLNAAIAAFDSGADYVYIHLEGPDECGHQGLLQEKIEAIRRIDRRIARPLLDWLEARRARTGEGWRVLVLPDHPTPLALRTHTSDPVPFVAAADPGMDEADFASRFLSAAQVAGTAAQAADAAVTRPHFSERDAKAAGVFVPDGFRLLAALLATADQ
ncbi:MAG: 2,3-bisphosphoglycerate-independent phosphoglycerate mutase [Bacillota bacterium]|nr:2,3-bisphosphoglycerate-independent phosphoglycerate mutase [Bacillota bacterium]